MPVILGEQTDASGLGAHAPGEVDVSVGAQYASFASDVGFDDESGANGSAHFQVWADGTRVAEIGTVTGADTAKHSTATCPVPASSGPSSQTLATATPPHHGDWADARVTCN